MDMTTDTQPSTPEQILGMPDERYALTPDELRAFADYAEKLEAIELTQDVTTTITVAGLPFDVKFGFDDTGSYGVLGVWFSDEAE